ncbi:hypothetical protein PROFUN_13965 [Planoprotostelium fungivorum]|uniref:Uncharacterized protein n=1 Tax=Planoprotostelium fungivorum TaxID=1890364 RepID=A0A2P6N2Q7_9EUKA|nr:hypothetical protein PROFUN_13965 [Planoprotostelium fungivorum]
MSTSEQKLNRSHFSLNRGTFYDETNHSASYAGHLPSSPGAPRTQKGDINRTNWSLGSDFRDPVSVYQASHTHQSPTREVSDRGHVNESHWSVGHSGKSSYQTTNKYEFPISTTNYERAPAFDLSHNTFHTIVAVEHDEPDRFKTTNELNYQEHDVSQRTDPSVASDSLRKTLVSSVVMGNNDSGRDFVTSSHVYSSSSGKRPPSAFVNNKSTLFDHLVGGTEYVTSASSQHKQFANAERPITAQNLNQMKKYERNSHFSMGHTQDTNPYQTSAAADYSRDLQFKQQVEESYKPKSTLSRLGVSDEADYATQTSLHFTGQPAERVQEERKSYTPGIVLSRGPFNSQTTHGDAYNQSISRPASTKRLNSLSHQASSVPLSDGDYEGRFTTVHHSNFVHPAQTGQSSSIEREKLKKISHHTHVLPKSQPNGIDVSTTYGSDFEKPSTPPKRLPYRNGSNGAAAALDPTQSYK